MFRSNLKLVNLRQCSGCWKYQPRRNFKVAVVGGSGGIGQPLSLLLKTHKLVTHLAVHDLKDSKGVAVDLSHIPNPCKVTSTMGSGELATAVKDAHVVVVCAGTPRKPGMSREELFDTNASVVAESACAIAKNSPSAMMAVITNPVNALTPLAAEVLKQNGTYDPNRLFGVTTLDSMRAEQFIGEILNMDPRKVKVPVIGGHAGTTILPIISQSQPAFKGDAACIAALVKRIQTGGDEVIQAKAGTGSATLSMAYAALRFTHALLKGLKGEESKPECAYVESSLTEACFFSTPLSFGPKGIAKNHGLPKLNDLETKALKVAVDELKGSIEKGIKHVS